MKSLDLKTLLIGLLLGVCVTLSMAQRAAEPAHKLDADYRYQISVAPAGDSYVLFVLDHETNKLYSRQGLYPGGPGQDIKQLIGEKGR